MNVYSNPQVAVIATFYNLESYVQRCVDSILQQVGFDNYEVILVNDGSKDGTANKLAEYSGESRVVVLNIENGGVANARNVGVATARAPLVTFVDGDDYISPYYLHALMCAREKSGCDFVVGANTIVKDGSADPIWTVSVSESCLSHEALIEDLLYEKVTESPCAKLAPKKLYEDLPFPRNRMYEDVAISGRHYLTVGDAAVIRTPIYAYVMRNNSVVHQRHAAQRQVEDFLWAIDEFLAPIEEAYPNFMDAVAYRRALELMRVWSVVETLEDERLKNMYEKNVSLELHSLWPTVRFNKDAPKINVVRMGFLVYAPRLYNTAFSAYESMRKGVKRNS